MKKVTIRALTLILALTLLLSVCIPAAAADSWTYDASGRVSEHQSWYGDLRYGKYIVRYTYDRQGNLVHEEHEGGGEISAVYDYTWSADGHMLGRREEHIFNSEGMENLVYTSTCTYDGVTGRKLSELRTGYDKDRSSTVYSYEYDGYGRVTKEKTVWTEADYVNENTVNYFYDDAGRLIRSENEGDGHRGVRTWEYAGVKG